MKTQIKFQKILALVTLIIAAVAFIYSICFFSGNLSDIMTYRLAGKRTNYVGRVEVDGVLHTITDSDPAIPSDYLTSANNWILDAQSTLSIIVTLGIIYFVVIAFVYIFGLNSRRNYYITNYVMTGVIVAYSLFFALYGFISIGSLMSSFYNITFDYPGDPKFALLRNMCALADVSSSPLIFVLGFIVYLLVVAIAVAWVYNLVWKIKLMNGEKALLAKGSVKEVV